MGVKRSTDDKYSNTATLVHDLKLMFQFMGQVKVSDKNIIGQSVDIRFDAGTPAAIGYRLSLDNDPCVITPSNNVKYIKVQSIGGVRSKTPTIIATNVPHFHQVSSTLTGFTPFTNSMFVPVS